MDARAAAAAVAARIPPGTVFVPHASADPDAVASAFALARAFDGAVAAPTPPTAAGRRLAEAVGCAVGLDLPADAPRRVLVDAGSSGQFRPWTDALAPFLLVDHHAAGDLAARAEAALVLPRTSCSEVALALLDAAGRPPGAEAAFALLVGLVDDTARFRYADRDTFLAAARLLAECGRPLDDALALLGEGDEEDSRSARLAALRAAQRMDVAEVGGLVVATSRVGSHEAQAAVGLVRCGADVALVASPRTDGGRVSGRGTRRAANVHLGEVFRAVAAELGASGGGHAQSAGMNGVADPERALARLLRAVEEAAK